MLKLLRHSRLFALTALAVPLLLGILTLGHLLEDHGDDCYFCRALGSGAALLADSCVSLAPAATTELLGVSVDLQAYAVDSSFSAPRGPPTS